MQKAVVKRKRTIQQKLKFFKSFGYEPHEYQVKAHEACCNHQFVTVCAGARGGKSMFAGGEGLDQFLVPGSHIWCVSSQYKLADKEFDWFLYFLARVKINGKRVIDSCEISSPGRGERMVRFPAIGSWICTKSEGKPESMLGEELDLIIVGEASYFKESTWDRILSMRITSRGGRVLPVSTPNGDSGFLRNFYDNGQNPRIPGWFSMIYSTWENPYISREELEKAKERMTDLNYREQVLGEFCSRRGMVYQITDIHYTHVLPPNYDNTPLVVGIYHKSNNPYSAVLIKYDVRTDTYLICDEISLENATAAEFAKKLREKFKKPGPFGGHRLKAIICDNFNKTLKKDLEIAGVNAITNAFENEYTKGQALSRQIHMMQNVLSKPGHLHFYAPNVPLTLESFKLSTWPDSNEEKGKEDRELPLERTLALSRAASFAVGFCENARGRWH